MLPEADVPAIEQFWESLRSGSAHWEAGARVEVVWHGLLSGAWIRLDVAREDSVQYLLARQVGATEERRALSPRRHEVLERTARADPGKDIALGGSRVRSAGAVSQSLRVGLERLGLSSSRELMFVCRGESELCPSASTHVARWDDEARGIAVLATSFDVVAFNAPVSPAEREVARSVIVGGTNQEIALARGRSRHAVANQVASILKKLRLSSRYELIARSLDWAPAAQLPARVPASLVSRFAQCVEGTR